MTRTLGRSLRATLLTIAVLTSSGCDGLIASLSGAYRGPMPSEENLTAETVIVRAVYTGQSEPIVHLMYVDRVSFIESRPHDINRVVHLRPAEVEPLLRQLKIGAGDRIRISTRFLHVGEGGGLGRHVPNWPHAHHVEHPIGVHALTSVERVEQ